MPIENDIWYGTSGPRDAKLMIVGESWGAEEYQHHKPFVGESGKELTRMLSEANIDRDKVFITNVAPDQPRDNDMSNFFDTPQNGTEFHGLHPSHLVRRGIDNLDNQICAINPSLIITCGNYATWALLPKVPTIKKVNGKFAPSGIMNTPRQGYRGSQYRTNNYPTKPFPVLPILHPASIMRSWHFRATTVLDLKKARNFLNGAIEWDDKYRQFITRPSYSETMDLLEHWLQNLESGQEIVFSVDIETYKEHMTCIGIARSTDVAICIPFVDKIDEKLVPYWTEKDHATIFWTLRSILSHPKCSVVGQNFLYDIQYISKWLHVVPKVKMDTMVAQHLCYPTLPKDLNYLSSIYCNYHRFWKGEGKEWQSKTSLDELWKYNCRDVVATLEISKTLGTVISQIGLTSQFQFQMEQFWLAFDLMQRGVLVDTKLKFDMKLQLMDKIHEIETWLESLISEDILLRKQKAAAWYHSNKQTADLFYETLGFKEQKHKKTGSVSANAEALKELGDKHPFIRPVTEALALLRTTSTFVTNFLSASLDRDNRMRCSYNVGGTYTFRLSSSENAFGRGTNLQNIPKNQEE